MKNIIIWKGQKYYCSNCVHNSEYFFKKKKLRLEKLESIIAVANCLEIIILHLWIFLKKFPLKMSSWTRAFLQPAICLSSVPFSLSISPLVLQSLTIAFITYCTRKDPFRITRDFPWLHSLSSHSLCRPSSFNCWFTCKWPNNSIVLRLKRKSQDV